MWRALDNDPYARRLRELLRRFRAQELSMTAVLLDLQAELEHWHLEASFLRLGGQEVKVPLRRRCRELQAECDLIATELVHVRMAISGAGEELADHEGRVIHAGSMGHPPRQAARA